MKNVLRDYCSLKVSFLGNSNITANHLKGLHLNKQGSLVLQNNLYEFANSFSVWLEQTANFTQTNQRSLPVTRRFKFASLNIRDLCKQIDELRVLLADSPIDVPALNETWLGPTISDNDVYITGYEIVRRDRDFPGADGKTYGGVCFYVRTNVNFPPHSDLSVDLQENLCIEIRKPNSKPFFLSPQGIDPLTRQLINLIYSKCSLGNWTLKMLNIIYWVT